MTDGPLARLAAKWLALSPLNRKRVKAVAGMLFLLALNRLIVTVNRGQMSTDLPEMTVSVEQPGVAAEGSPTPRMPEMDCRSPFEPQHRTRGETSQPPATATAATAAPAMSGAVRLVGVVIPTGRAPIAILSRQLGKNKSQQWSARVGESVNGVAVLAATKDTVTVATPTGTQALRIEH